MRDAARHAAPAPPERPGAAGDPGAASPERVVSELAATLFARGLDDAAAAAAVADAAQRALGADRATCYTISADRTVGSVHTTETDPARRAAITAARGRGPHDAPIWRLTIGCPDPVLAVPDAGRHPGVPAGLARALGVSAFLALRLDDPAGGRAELGYIFATWARPRPIGARERDVSHALAGVAAPALAAARLHARTQDALRQARRDRAALERAQRIATSAAGAGAPRQESCGGPPSATGSPVATPSWEPTATRSSPWCTRMTARRSRTPCAA